MEVMQVTSMNAGMEMWNSRVSGELQVISVWCHTRNRRVEWRGEPQRPEHRELWAHTHMCSQEPRGQIHSLQSNKVSIDAKGCLLFWFSFLYLVVEPWKIHLTSLRSSAPTWKTRLDALKFLNSKWDSKEALNQWDKFNVFPASLV